MLAKLQIGDIAAGTAVSSKLTIAAENWLAADFEIADGSVRHRRVVGKVPKGAVRGEIRIVLFPMGLIEFAAGKLLPGLADDLGGCDRKDLEEPIRDVGEPQIGIHFIDPVTCGLCDIAKSLFARFDCDIIGGLRLGGSKMGQQPMTHDPNISAGRVQWRLNSNTEKPLAIKIDGGRASFEHGRGACRFLGGHCECIEFAGHDPSGSLMKAADARSLGGGKDPAATAKDRDDRVDLGGDLVANVLKNAGF